MKPLKLDANYTSFRLRYGQQEKGFLQNIRLNSTTGYKTGVQPQCKFSFLSFFCLSGSFPLNNLPVFDRQIKITLEKDLMNNTSKLYNTFFAERADFPWFIIPDKHRLLHTWIPAGKSPVTSTIWKTRRKSMAMLHWYYPTLMRMHSGAKNSWCSWITSLETLSSLWAWLSQL